MLALTKTISFALFLALTFIFIGSFFLLPLTDWDTALYCLIGKGIISKHILPYGYIFDHKPYLVYVFYYLWDAVIPLSLGKFPLLALCSLIFIAYLSKNIFNINGKLTFAILFLGGIPTNYMDGNSEVLQIPFIFSSLFLLLKGSKTGETLSCVLSSFLAVITLNINYLSGFILFPLFLYIISSSEYKKKYFLISSTSTIVSLFIVMLPFIWKGHGDIIEYFGMQHHFINKYGADLRDRLISLRDTIVPLSIIYPIFLYSFNCKPPFIFQYKVRILVLWILSSLLSSILSGHSYKHYWALFIIPTMILAAILFKRRDPKIFMIMIPLLCYDTLTMINVSIGNISQVKKVKRANIPYLHNTINNAQVLGIDANPDLYYLSNIETYDRFLFPGHVDIYFGVNAEDYYLKKLSDSPSFVITPYNACGHKDLKPSICGYLMENYQLIHQAYNHKAPSHNNIFYYDLYKSRGISPKR